jgi:lipoprotein-anchoring transpeptidase ErfK/SrfK
VLVGGLSPADATLIVKEYFARPLTLRLGKVTLRVTPKQLGSSAYVGDAIKRARVAAPGANVPLKVKAPRSNVERYVRKLAARFDRPAVDSQQLFRNSKPFVTKERTGKRLLQEPVVRSLFLSLKTHAREPIAMKQEAVKPRVTRASAGYVIVIHRGENRLRLYDGMRLHRTFGVATGESRYPTPLGNFHVVVKWRDPWWYPPASDWAKDAEPIPPGPGNPLGTRWMGLSAPAVGIHGTPDPASIGYSVSHGCIRMRIPEAEWLFNQIEIGTPVYIVR